MASIAQLIANYSPSTYAANERVAEEQAKQAPIATDIGQQELEQKQIQNKIAQRQLQDQDIIQRAMVNTDGTLPAVRRYLVQNGISGRGFLDWQANMAALQKNYAGLQGQQLENAAKIHQQVGNILQAYQGLPPEQRAAQWNQTRAQIAALEPGETVPAQPPDDATLRYYLTSHGMLGTILNQAKTKAGIAQTEATTAASQAAAGKAAAETPGAAAESTMKQRQAAAMTGGSPEADAALVDSAIDPAKYPDENRVTKAQVANARKLGLGPQAIQGAIKDGADRIANRESQIAAAKAKAPITINTGMALDQAKALANANEDDYRRAGEQYAISGVMPPLGMGSAGRAKILHYAGEYARQNGLSPRDLALAQAAFRGDESSLRQLQSQADKVASFENTAKKNLDLFLDLASKIPDTGSPWINTPIRLLSEKMIGSANMAAVNAAREVANNEIAKVTGGGTGSQALSDAARREVQDYNPRNATFAQTRHIAQVLKQDMANRTAGYTDAINQIKGRIGAPQPTTQAANGGEQRIRVKRRSDGQTGTIKASDFDAGKYDKL